MFVVCSIFVCLKKVGFYFNPASVSEKHPGCISNSRGGSRGPQPPLVSNVLNLWDVFWRTSPLGCLLLSCSLQFRLLVTCVHKKEPSGTIMNEEKRVAEVWSLCRLRVSFLMMQSWWTGSSSPAFWIWHSCTITGNRLGRGLKSSEQVFRGWRGAKLDIKWLGKYGGRSRGEPTSTPEEETCATWIGGPEKGELRADPLTTYLQYSCCWLAFQWETSKTLPKVFNIILGNLKPSITDSKQTP